MREGGKFHEWERKGVPVRIDVGPRDVAAGTAIVTRRDRDGHETIAFADLPERIPSLLADIQRTLFADALAFRDTHLFAPATFDEAVEVLANGGGFVRAGWCGDAACEERMKAATRATIRCLPLDAETPAAACIVCGRPAVAGAVWGLAY